MNAMTEPLVSVVTPFYNTERYLAECIESVLKQSYRNFEYILLNNCSTDASLQIAESYARKDKRIIVFSNKEFLSQVQNYNHALEKLSTNSKYCKVVQADDWIFPQCLQEMVALAETDDKVAIVGSYYLCGTKVAGDGLPYHKSIINGREICKLQLLKGYFFFGSPTSLLYRADIVRGQRPFYSEDRLHEDTEVCYDILKNHDFGFIHQVLTYSRMGNESITTSVSGFNPNSLDKFIIIQKYAKLFLTNKEYEECVITAKNKYFQFLARSIFEGKPKSFWDYQRRGLQTVGIRFSRLMLGKYIVVELIDIIFNLKKTVRRIIKLKKNLRKPNQ